MTRVHEKTGGTHGGTYYHVVEGSQLVRVGQYSTSRSREDGEIIYRVPERELKGKRIIRFSFSNSGLLNLAELSIEAFDEGCLKTDALRRLERHDLEDLRFADLHPNVSELTREFRESVVPMVDELQGYASEKGFDFAFGGSRRLNDAMEDPETYLLGPLAIPSNEARARSIKHTRGQVFQLWVMMNICKAFDALSFRKTEEGYGPYWWLDQGTEPCTCIAETINGPMTMWHEFQVTRGAHLAGIGSPSRVPTRPDIVAKWGAHGRTDDLLEETIPIDLLVECKEGPSEEWQTDVDSQIGPYRRIFNPDLMVVALMRSVPSTIREDVERAGAVIVDGLGGSASPLDKIRDALRPAR